MAVTTDVASGSSVVESAESGFTATRVFFVTELSGSFHQLPFVALQQSGIPQLNEAHPSIPGIVVTNRTSEPIATKSGQCRVTTIYSLPTAEQQTPSEVSEGTRSTGASLVSKITNFDKNGDLMLTTGKVEIVDASGNKSTKIVAQVAEAEFEEPVFVFRANRRESVNPAGTVISFVGRVNSVPIWFGGSRQWLCTRIDATTSDGGKTYDVLYEFQFNEDTWDAVVVFRDPNTGQPPVNPDTFQSELLVPGGLRTYRIYRSVDFGLLKITF